MPAARKLHKYTTATQGKEMVSSSCKSPPRMVPDKIRIALSRRKKGLLSKQAKKEGKKRHAIDIATTKLARNPERKTDNSTLPDELYLDDGWNPGPRPGSYPPAHHKFTGDDPGVVDKALTDESTAYDYMLTQITEADKKLVLDWTADAIAAFNAKKKAAGRRLSRFDWAIHPDRLKESTGIFDLWLAARVKTSMLPLGVDQKALWDRHSDHYCLALNASLPYFKYRFLNKHLQFTMQVDDADCDEESKEKEADLNCEDDGEVSDEEDPNEGYDFVKIMSNERVTVSKKKKNQVVYVAADDQTPREIAEELDIPLARLLKDNLEGLTGLKATSKLQEGTELSVGTCADVGVDEAESEEDSDATDSEEEKDPDEIQANQQNQPGVRVSDRLRKRRALETRIKQNWAAAFRPVKHLSWDEMVRNHKHWHCVRLKFKPNVHSGSLFDAVCCCRTFYCVAGEEQGTDPSKNNALPARAERLLTDAKCKDQHYVGT